MKRLWLVALILGAAPACSTAYYAKGTPLAAPKLLADARFDIEASEIVIEAVGGQMDLPKNRGELIRAEIAEAMNVILGIPPNATGGIPARFRLKASYESEAWPVYVCLLYLTVIGCPVAIQTVDMDLDIEIAGKRYSTNFTDWVVTGLYYNVRSLRPALAVTLRGALRKIADEMADQ